jgi:DNA-binding transcriptional ArsR family regulator
MEAKIEEEITEDVVFRAAELFSALSDSSRIRILIALLHKEMNVRSLAETVGISESAASHHLRNLRYLRLVRARKQGRKVFYCLDDEHIRELLQSGLDHVLHG